MHKLPAHEVDVDEFTDAYQLKWLGKNYDVKEVQKVLLMFKKE